MIRYALRRLLSAIPTMLVIITAAFFLLHAAPGGPFDAQKQLLPEIKASIERTYHLDEPLYKQYLRYLGSIARGDLGPSYQYRDTTVNQIIRQGFPIDVIIGGLAMLCALAIGLPIGMVAAMRRNSWEDHLLTGVAMLGISIPVFVIAPILILVLAVNLHWLPAGDWANGAPLHIILPTVALAAPYIAYVTRLMRGSTAEVLNSPFILMARAKGLPKRTIILRHAMKPALIPLVSFLGPALAGLITGSIVIETIFSLPGIGRAFVTGALNRDYTLVLGVTILYGALIVGFNLLADLSYSVLDPQGALPMSTDFRRETSTESFSATVTSSAPSLAPLSGFSSAPLGRSLWDDAFSRMRHNRMAMVCAIVLAIIILAAIVVPLFSPYSYYAPEWTLRDAPPTLRGGHIFGTDDLGRDLLVRVMWGCRVSLLIGIVASLVSIVIGVVWGATAGYAGGSVDSLMMRVVDILYAVPFIPFVIVLVVMFGRNILLIFVAIGAVSWLDIARIVRGQTLTLRNKEFVEAARASGVSGTRIVTRHLIPNLLGIVVIYATLTVPSVILFEAFLSFLGLGVQSPMTSLGVMVSDGASELQSYPYLLLVPAVLLALIVYCLNFLGDGLHEALDPKEHR